MRKEPAAKRQANERDDQKRPDIMPEVRRITGQEELADGIREEGERKCIRDILHGSWHGLMRPGVTRKNEGDNRIHDDAAHEFHLLVKAGGEEHDEAHGRQDERAREQQELPQRCVERNAHEILHEEDDKQI